MKDEPGFHRPPRQKGFNGNRHKKQKRNPKDRFEERKQAEMNAMRNSANKNTNNKKAAA